MIVNIGSVLGEIGNPGFATYCASKAGLTRFSEALARELQDGPVKVIQVNPRSIDTGMNSESVALMNRELKVKSDPPHTVAMQILARIDSEKSGTFTLGWPERLYVKLNALFLECFALNFYKWRQFEKIIISACYKEDSHFDNNSNIFCIRKLKDSFLLNNPSSNIQFPFL